MLYFDLFNATLNVFLLSDNVFILLILRRESLARDVLALGQLRYERIAKKPQITAVYIINVDVEI